MGRPEEMRQLGDEMIASLKWRLANIEEIRQEVKLLFAEVELMRQQNREELKQMFKELWQMLKEDRERRVLEVKEFLAILRNENRKTHEIWQQVLRELQKIREESSYKRDA